MAPNLAEFVELPGGHCAILERPDEVNAQLRRLVESVSEPNGADGLARQRAVHFGGRSTAGPHRTVQETGPLVGGFGACPEDPIDGLA